MKKSVCKHCGVRIFQVRCSTDFWEHEDIGNTPMGVFCDDNLNFKNPDNNHPSEATPTEETT
jgi:hypothetical protein